ARSCSRRAPTTKSCCRRRRCRKKRTTPTGAACAASSGCWNGPPCAGLPTASIPRTRPSRLYVAERFAAFAREFRSVELAGDVLHHAKRAVIDWHAALYPGAVAAPAVLLEKALADELDRGNSRLALGRKATVRAAALINGTAAHTAEVDDIFRD